MFVIPAARQNFNDILKTHVFFADGSLRSGDGSSSRKEDQPVDHPGSLWRQYLVIFLVNLVTLLQGASLPTSTVTVPQIVANLTSDVDGSNENFPAEFDLNEAQGTEVGKANRMESAYNFRILSVN